MRLSIPALAVALLLPLAACTETDPPGDTPTPTATPGLPLCTPGPTVAPTPTPVPQPCNSANEQCGPYTCNAEGSATMLPGANCQSCHSPGNLPNDVRALTVPTSLTIPTSLTAEDNLNWTIAGTAFSDIFGTAGLKGATIQVTDSKGKVVTLTTNKVGNFYSNTAITPPITAKITAGGQTYEMTTPASSGACNSCHQCDGPPGGKLYGGPQATPAPTPTPLPSDCVTPDPQASTFSSINSSILQPSCALSGCHGKGSASGGLSLDSASAYGNLVGVASRQLTSMLLVKPNEPANSYLWHKVQGDQSTVGGGGGRMPPTGALSSTKLQYLNQWITEGAQNN